MAFAKKITPITHPLMDKLTWASYRRRPPESPTRAASADDPSQTKRIWNPTLALDLMEYEIWKCQLALNRLLWARLKKRSGTKKLNKRLVIVSIAVLFAITISVVVLVLGTSQISGSPPNLQCEAVPHPVPQGIQTIVSQIENNPKFVLAENGTSFQFSENSMSTEQYYNGSSYSVQYFIFVHIISNHVEDKLTISILPNQSMIYSAVFDSSVTCVSAGAAAMN